MEPPVKRRRQGASTFRSSLGSNNETEIDELAEPSLPPSPDQGYQLAVKRAQANQRLNATMAHIIEKYSQNFDGIGDEIDMETGEIVVNNGHLRGMRHEGDLGGGDYEDGGEGDDDDEGLLLEDLIEDSSDGEQVDDREVQDSDEVDNEGDDPKSSYEAEGGGAIGAQLGALASLLPNGYGGGIFIGFLPGLGAPPQGLEASKLTSGIPPINQNPHPMMMGPWGMPGLLPQQTWGQLGVANQQLPLPTPHVSTEKTPKPKGERYKFPTQFGDTSIWAPHSRQQDDNTPAPKRRAGRPAKLQDQTTPVQRSATASQSSSWEDTDATGSGRDEQEASRRSGRVRKQVEYMGRVSWQEASKELELNSSPSSQPSGSDKNASQEGIITPKSSQQVQDATKPKDTAETELRRVIPDSQDSATPPASSAPQPSQPQQTPKEGQKDLWATIFSGSGVDPALNLSDDEAPLPVLDYTPAEPHAETQTHELDLEHVGLESLATPGVSKERGAIRATNGPSFNPNSEPKRKTRPPGKDSASPATSSGSKRPIGRPKKESESPAVILGSEQPVGQLQEDSTPGVSIEPKRASRRLRNKPEAQAQAPAPAPATNPKRKVGRPRKVAEPPAAIPPREIENLQISSQGLAEAVPLPDQAATVEGAQNQGSDPRQMLTSPVLEAVTELHMSTLGDLEETHGASHSWPATKAIPAISAAEDTLPLLADDTMPLLADESLPVEDPLPVTIEDAPPPQTKNITPQLVDEKISQLAANKQPRQASTPKRKMAPFHEVSQNTPQKPSQTPSRSSKPSTPRFTAIRTTRAPSSRRSILSLVSADSDSDNDELGRDHPRRPDLSVTRSSVASKIKAWRSSALTTEAARTPVKKRHGEPVSPGSVIKTPGGTVRTCGIGGYQCGRDFCFTCL
ncbi:hypothetical protein B0J13DRAFT_655189 [Dactylonectria estremocensis]|uniref:Uncharacterized protein n=1 Tax=Dactylonectria estremocensis TaxID=1079267 RepID=A0A9P9F7W0_9HYPO|nr:hypothetical protein B0J13DRAFT_655189 [Dactylonectria estremocensis]